MSDSSKRCSKCALYRRYLEPDDGWCRHHSKPVSPASNGCLLWQPAPPPSGNRCEVCRHWHSPVGSVGECDVLCRDKVALDVCTRFEKPMPSNGAMEVQL